jgi:hypothetical protein
MRESPAGFLRAVPVVRVTCSYVIDAADLKLCLLLRFFWWLETDSQRRHLPVNVARRPGRRRAGASYMQEFGSQRWVVSNPAGIGRLRD